MVTSPLTAATFLGGYLEFLRRDGWQVALVCGDGPGVAELATRAGARFIPLPMEREPSPLRDLRSLFSTWKLLRRLRPDVVVYATPKASLLGSLAGWMARVPNRIYELWGLRLETTSGAARQVYSTLEKLTMRFSTQVIANSRSLADRVVALGLNGGREVEVLGSGSSHGVDSAKFSRTAPMPDMAAGLAESLSRSTLPVVGFVGRLHPDKGITTLVAAVEELAGRGVPVACLLVGGDEGAVLPGSGGGAEFYFAGQVDDPRPYIRAMDVLVLPSLREGFPNVVLEAAAMQVPAIVTDATGCIDSVVPGVTGEVFPVGDSEALAILIQELSEDPDRLKRMGEAARARAIEHYDPEKVWKAHSGAFRSGARRTGGALHG